MDPVAGPRSTRQPDREAQAQAELGRTEIARGVAVLLVAGFLISLAGVPLSQQAFEIRDHVLGRRASAVPGSLEIVAALPRAAVDFARAQGGPWDRLLAANRSLTSELRRYESALEEDSRFGQAAFRATQARVTALLHTGNEQVYLGRGGWLYLRSTVDYVTGPPFLDPADLARRDAAAGTGRPGADPRPAIAEFGRAIAERGARLLLVVNPDKASIHPEPLAPSCTGPALANPSLARLYGDLAAAGIDVFDPSDLLRDEVRSRGRPMFLRADTHWTPEAMEVTAEALADRIRRLGVLPPLPPAGYVRTQDPQGIENRGDLLSVLRLPVGQTLFLPERVAIHPVFTARGQPWQPSRRADVLVLGNSYSNMYAQVGLGWGAGAGLVEQVSFLLQRPMDTLLRNGRSAHATRETLAREMARGRDRLAGKRLVVWQIAARELVIGDWRRVDLSLGRPATRSFLRLSPGETVTVRGTLAALAPIPRPATTPYPEQIRAAHVVDLEPVEGALNAGEALVYAWGMRGGAWTDFGKERVGQRLTFRLRPWSDVEAELDKEMRNEVDDEALLAAEPAWADEVRP